MKKMLLLSLAANLLIIPLLSANGIQSGKGGNDKDCELNKRQKLLVKKVVVNIGTGEVQYFNACNKIILDKKAAIHEKANVYFEFVNYNPLEIESFSVNQKNVFLNKEKPSIPEEFTTKNDGSTENKFEVTTSVSIDDFVKSFNDNCQSLDTFNINYKTLKNRLLSFIDEYNDLISMNSLSFESAKNKLIESFENDLRNCLKKSKIYTSVVNRTVLKFGISEKGLIYENIFLEKLKQFVENETYQKDPKFNQYKSIIEDKSEKAQLIIKSITDDRTGFEKSIDDAFDKLAFLRGISTSTGIGSFNAIGGDYVEFQLSKKIRSSQQANNIGGPLTINVVGGVRVNFSAGVYFTYLHDKEYVLKSSTKIESEESLQGDSVVSQLVNKDYTSIIENKGDQFSIGYSTNIHVISNWNRMVNCGFYAGTGFTINDFGRAVFTGGVSFVVGKEERFCLNIGGAAAKVKRLNPIYSEGLNSGKIETVPYSEVWSIKSSIGVSINLKPKKEAKAKISE